jgi:holo-ACP synthase
LINNILQDREKRYYEILSLLSKYRVPVICGKINYPGDDKNTLEAQNAFQILRQLLTEKFAENSMDTQILTGDDGSSILIATSLKPLEAKKVAVSIENSHPLGRIFDIDVYGVEGVSIGREELGMESRKCIICNENARVCMRTACHSFQEVVDKVNELIRSCCASLM